MADEFDLRQVIAKGGKTIDAKAFPDLDRFVKETDQLQDEVDEIHRARNKILSSIKRGAVDNRAIDTYDKLTTTVVKDAAKLRQHLAKLQTAADVQLKAMKTAKNAAGLKVVNDFDARLDKVGVFLAGQKNFPDSEQWLLASLGGMEADDGPGKRKGSADPSKLPALKHAPKIAANTPGASFENEIEWFEKNASDVDLSALKKVRAALPKIDAVKRQHDKVRPQLKDYLAYLRDPATAPEPPAASVKALDALADDAAGAVKIVEAAAAIVRKLPRKTPREKSAAQSLLAGLERVEKVLEDSWQSLRPTGTGWSARPGENVARAKAAQAKVADRAR